MIIAASIKQILDSNRFAYIALQHKRVTSLESAASLLNIDPNQVLVTQVVADSYGELLVVYPLGRKIDFDLCRRTLKRDLKFLPSINANRIFNDCEAGCWPAIGHPYHVDVIIDQSIKQLTSVYFASGSHTSLLQMAAADYLRINSRAKIFSFTEASQFGVDQASDDIADHVGILDNIVLPELPPIAIQILQLAISKEHSTKELIDLVTQDPGMQQQIGYYMQLPFMQERLNDAKTTHDSESHHAIEHVLGFDMVSHIALGVAAGRAFNIARIVGAEDFWRHSFYAAIYAQRITELVAERLELDPAISYLAGMFHNFGLLLFSQLFPPEYNLLQKWLRLNPKVSIAILEQRLLGMGQAFNVARGGHAQLGAWLLRHWNMPEAICVITKEHHSLTYTGKYALYVRIIQLTNQLLREVGIGDGSAVGINEQLLEPLGLTAQEVYASVQQLKTGAASLDQMARSLTCQ
jgi:HD-like signal output (HDOD) protein/prolyl-tRNA editing enzyme YbaK/EbsC (Cys-tRNA(Pro) deacylase)